MRIPSHHCPRILGRYTSSASFYRGGSDGSSGCTGLPLGSVRTHAERLSLVAGSQRGSDPEGDRRSCAVRALCRSSAQCNVLHSPQVKRASRTREGISAPCGEAVGAQAIRRGHDTHPHERAQDNNGSEAETSRISAGRCLVTFWLMDQTERANARDLHDQLDVQQMATVPVRDHSVGTRRVSSSS